MRPFALLFAIALGLVYSSSQGHAQGKSLHVERSKGTGSPSLGPKDAPIQCRLFLNLTHRSSYRVFQRVLSLAGAHPFDLRVEIVLASRRSPSSGVVSLAQVIGQESIAQGRFFDFMRAFGNRSRPSSLDVLESDDKLHFLDITRIRKAYDKRLHDEDLHQNYLQLQRAGLRVVPSMTCNGLSLARISSATVLEQAYRRLKNQTEALQAAGVATADIPTQASLQIAASWELDLSDLVDYVEDGTLPSTLVLPKALPVATLLSLGHRKGKADAPFPIFFVCRMQSVWCRNVYRRLVDLMSMHPDQLAIIFLPSLDAQAVPGQELPRRLSLATLCAAEQDLFWPFLERAIDTNRSVSLFVESLDRLAETENLALDSMKLLECIESESAGERLDAQLQAVEKAGLKHTPALVMGGRALFGHLSLQALERVYQSFASPGFFESLASPKYLEPKHLR